jgi:hypothetical protein
MLHATCTRSFGIAALLTLLLGIAPALASAPPRTPATTSDTTRGIVAAKPTRPAEAARQHDYAAREAASKDLETFKGGDTVVIGASVLTIVLAVILLIVLL